MATTKENCIARSCYNTDLNDVKYGDSDVSSKRRKLENFQGDGNKEEVDNMDVSGIESYAKFEEDIDKNYLQSSFNDVAKCNEYCVNDDLNEKYCLKGSLPNTKHETSAKNFTTITDKPSVSSKGFENSFKLLQHQIQTKKIKEGHSTISLCSATSEHVANDYEPTRLEIELEAMRHIRTIVYKLETKGELQNISMPLLALCYSFLSKKHCKDIFKGSTAGSDESSTLINHINAGLDVNLKYHVGKDTDGSKCLKIVRHLLKHKVLCGSRVSQMTRTYDDIEAVTRLLEEKEKDLELTVQIGKELLTQNNILENKIADLEAELKTSNEDRSQLIHELHKKNELIAVLTNDCEDSSDNDTPTFSKSVTLDLLQKKITSLQDENKSLKNEVSQLAFQTDEIEEQERQLMSDITSQLNDTNKQFDNLSLDLERQREENRLQHEQIVSLTARLSEAEMRLHQLTHDNDEHITLLNITKENQNSLALELVEFKQRYQEVLALLQEAQDQLRKQRKKSMPQARSSFMSTISNLQPDSLQSELMESSLYSENSLDSGISAESQRINDRIGRLMSQLPNSSSAVYNSSANPTSGILPPYRRVFDTVRCASKSGSFAENDCTTSMSHLGAMSISTVSGPRMSTMSFGNNKNIGSAALNNDHVGMGVRSLSCESLASHSDDGYPSQPCGVPGAPGAKELEAALKRLTPAEVLARRAMLSYAPAGTYSYEDHQPSTVLPLGLRTPDSILSTGSSGMSSSTNMSTSFQQWRLPEKLQIVKPIEGSQTLHHWSQLATPTLSGLLEERPGVTIRGGRGLDDLGMQIYTLSDVEEDVTDDLPGKQFEISGCTYTYTTSTVLHPDDGLSTDMSFLSQSQVSSRAASTSTSRQPSCPQTPRAGLSRKNSCSTFSVNLGLASMLNERGIKAVTPSALNTPAGPNFSPTVTPCNSPEGSPTRSMSPEPLFGLLSSGADLIRRKLVGGDIERPNRNQQQKIMLTRLERRALRSLRLIEKVESIGLENIITTQPSTMSQLASGIANRSASPMSQLTSLKNIHTNSNNIVSDLHFNRSQIKDVLQKGLHTQQLHANKSSSLDVPVDLVSTISNANELNIKDEEHKNQHKYVANAQIRTASDVAATENDNSNIRVKQLQRQKSRRNLKNGQRSDLGTIGGRVRSDLGRVSSKEIEKSNLASTSSNANNTLSFDKPDNKEQQHSIAHSFVGTVSSLLFSRKGGWL